MEDGALPQGWIGWSKDQTLPPGCMLDQVSMKYNPSGLILFCQTKIILKYDANAGQIYGRLKILGLASYQPLL